MVTQTLLSGVCRERIGLPKIVEEIFGKEEEQRSDIRGCVVTQTLLSGVCSDDASMAELADALDSGSSG